MRNSHPQCKRATSGAKAGNTVFRLTREIYTGPKAAPDQRAGLGRA